MLLGISIHGLIGADFCLSIARQVAFVHVNGPRDRQFKYGSGPQVLLGDFQRRAVVNRAHVHTAK